MATGYAYIKNLQTNVKSVVEATEIYELMDGSRRKRLSNVLFDPHGRYAIEEEDFLVRVMLYAVADTKESLLAKLKGVGPNSKLRAVVAPARRSMGPTKEPLKNYIVVEESRAARAQQVKNLGDHKKVKQDRCGDILHHYKKKNAGKVDGIVVNENDGEGADAGPQPVGNSKKKKTEKCLTKKHPPATSQVTQEQLTKKVPQATIQDSQEQSGAMKREAKKTKDLEDADEHLTFQPSKRMCSTPLRAPHPKKPKVPCKECDEEKDVMFKELQGLRNMCDDLMIVNKKLVKELQEKESILQKLAVIKELLEKDSVLDKLAVIHKDVQHIIKLQSAFDKRQDSPICELGQMKSAVKECSCGKKVLECDCLADIPADMIYFGEKSRFLSKKDIIRLEKTQRSVNGRVRGLAELFWPDGEARQWNLAGKDKMNNPKNRVKDVHVEAMSSLLSAMAWKRGRNNYNLTTDNVRRVLGKQLYLISADDIEEEGEEDNGEEKRNENKDIEIKGIDGNEDEVEVQVQTEHQEQGNSEGQIAMDGDGDPDVTHFSLNEPLMKDDSFKNGSISLLDECLFQ